MTTFKETAAKLLERYWRSREDEAGDRRDSDALDRIARERTKFDKTGKPPVQTTELQMAAVLDANRRVFIRRDNGTTFYVDINPNGMIRFEIFGLDLADTVVAMIELGVKYDEVVAAVNRGGR